MKQSNTGSVFPAWKRALALPLFCLLPALVCGCSGAPAAPASRTEVHLDTVVSVTLYDSQGKERDEEILDACMSRIADCERCFSRTDPDSELYRLNHGLLPAVDLPGQEQAQRVSPQLGELIGIGLAYGRLSGGALDITIAPVSALWPFGSGAAAASHAVPDADAVAKAVRLVDYRDVTLTPLEDGYAVSFQKAGMAIDLGAVAKGYIADLLRETLEAEGVQSALLNLGGSVVCIGSRNGEAFRVGVQKPFAPQGETAAVLSLTDSALVSSGTYERCFTTEDGFYHHILDPSTGYPCQNGLTGVTILTRNRDDARSAAAADALSTACFLLGEEKGLALIESLPDTEALFLTDSGRAVRSSGFPQP